MAEEAPLPSDAPVWPEESVFPARGLTVEELAIEPKAGWMRADDGYALAYQCWPVPKDQPVRGIVVVLHGVQSHAGWYQGLGRRLAAAGLMAFFYDRRGSGANPKARGHARSSNQLIGDVRTAIQQARKLAGSGAGGRLPVILAGISWGGKIVVLAAAKYPDLVDGIALLCPGLAPRVGVTMRERLAIISALITGRSSRVRLPIPLADPALFTSDGEGQAFIAGDPLSLRDATARLLAASFFLDRKASRVHRRLTCPTLLMLAGQDRIINNAHTRAYVERLAATNKHTIEYPLAHHTLEFEADPSEYVHDFLRWVERAIPGIGEPGESRSLSVSPREQGS